MTSSQNVERDPAEPGADTQVRRDARPTAPASFVVCPYLAGGDGTWASVQPTKSHVCAAVSPPAVLATGKQRQLCLTVEFASCATYRAASAIAGRSVPEPFDADLWPSTTPRVVTVEPVRSGLAGGLTSPQARVGGQAVLVGLIIVAFVILVATRTTPQGGTSPDSSPGAPAASAVAAPGGLQASAVPTAAPTQAPAVPASAAPTATPGGSPAAERTYKVKSGDTLSSIALRFGVTVKAIRRANGLSTDDVIRRGQVLVIPAAQASAVP